MEQLMQMIQSLPPEGLMALYEAIGQMLQSAQGGPQQGMEPGMGGGAPQEDPAVMEALLSQQMQRGRR